MNLIESLTELTQYCFFSEYSNNVIESTCLRYARVCPAHGGNRYAGATGHSKEVLAEILIESGNSNKIFLLNLS